MDKIKLLFLAIIIFSCKQSIENEPDNLVPKEKMINILSDIHRTEGFINNMNIQNTDTTSFIYRKLEAQIFKKHGVDTSTYYKSYKYYLVNPDEFTEMYKEVVASIKSKNKIDSLKEAKSKKITLDTNKLENKRAKIAKLRTNKFDSIQAIYRNKLIK